MRKSCPILPQKEELPQPTSSARYESAEFRQLKQPCVYATWQNGRRTYVGFSEHGLKRVLYADSANPKRSQAFAEAEQVTVSYYSTEDEAFLAEAWTIHKYHPVFNNYCPACPRYRGAKKGRKEPRHKKWPVQNG